MAIVGYGRVSTLDQDLDTQIAALRAAGAEKVFSEKISGKTAERPELKDMLDWIREGDLLIVTRLDRLGRSMLDLLKILEVVQNKGCGFRCLNQGGVDTTTPEGRMMLGILAAFAEFERFMIQERQAVGIANAKHLGKYRGKKVQVPVDEIHRLLAAGWGPAAIAKKLKVNRATVSRHTPEDLKNPQPPGLRADRDRKVAARHAELRP